MRQVAVSMVDGPMGGSAVFVGEDTSRFVYSTGDVYLKSEPEIFVWSRQETEMEKRRLNEFFARRKGKRK